MRNRLVVLVAVLLVVGLGAVYFFGLRNQGKEEETAKPTPVAPVGPTAPRPATPDEPEPAPPSEGRVRYDDDPRGTYRVEGQVVDADEQGVGGAAVTISTRPPRTAKTEGDGS